MGQRDSWRLFLMIFIPFGLGHFISYLFRTINAVIYTELMNDLQLTAEGLGLLTSLYFLAFAAAQIPLGLLLDRYGPRIVQGMMLLVAALGALLFAYSSTLRGLFIGRALIGLGVSGSLMSLLKACRIWLPKERLALATSAALAIGGLGAMMAASPFHLLLEYLSWRTLFKLLGVATLIVSGMILFFVRLPYQRVEMTFGVLMQSVGALYRSKQFWRLALYSLFPHAVYLATLALWMGPWLQDVAGFSSGAMANGLLIGAMAMVGGSLTFGALTDRLQRHQVPPLLICGVGIIGFLSIQLLMVLNIGFPPMLSLLLFSFFGASSAMNYAIIAQSVPQALSGRVTTSYNLLVFLLSFLLQWLVGAIIGLWDGEGGYPIPAYQWAFTLLLLLQIPGVFLWLSFKPWRRSLRR